jgi:saccharopepsin
VQESVPINTQLEQLGQKYMGLRPRQSHADAVFNGMVADVKGNHPVPISNFMNAQCMCTVLSRAGDSRAAN